MFRITAKVAQIFIYFFLFFRSAYHKVRYAPAVLEEASVTAPPTKDAMQSWIGLGPKSPILGMST